MSVLCQYCGWSGPEEELELDAHNNLVCPECGSTKVEPCFGVTIKEVEK